MKKYLLVFAIISIVFVSGCVETVNGLIGGQRDEHGCLGPAGYSWNETIGICMREWEVTDAAQREATKLVADYITKRRITESITLDRIEVKDCIGCFDIYVSTDRFRFKVIMENWKIKSETLLS